MDIWAKYDNTILLWSENELLPWNEENYNQGLSLFLRTVFPRKPLGSLEDPGKLPSVLVLKFF